MPNIEKSKKPWIPKRPKTNLSWSYDKRYHTTRWRNYRLNFLKLNPLCKLCKDVGKTIASNVVDHINPVSASDSDDNFWNGPHQALCRSCNNRKSQTDRKR